MTSTARSVSPFRKEGILRRTAPFGVAMILGFAAIELPAGHRNGREILIAAVLNVVIVAAIVLVPWERLPRSADVLPPLAYMIVVALLRDALGGAASAYSTLLIVPVLWIALHGTRTQLGIGVAGVLVLLAMPVLVIGKPDYASDEWRRVLLWTFVSGIVGLATQDLVDQVRQRADALHTVSEAVGRRTREIETRSAICEAAKENAGAQYALLLERDTNGRRLVTTAATDASVEGTELYLSNHALAAVRAFKTGRDQFEPNVTESPLSGDRGASTPVASLFWHVVPGGDGPLGVLGLGWTQRVKRLPETIPPVMEALAAEAGGVIERTTLLVRLEEAVKEDDATGLPNERAWEEEVAREVSRARRQGDPLSVVVLSVTGFEVGPDGELPGAARKQLRELADGWRRELGPADYLAHRGTGSFGVLLPGVGEDAAEAAATKLRTHGGSGRSCTAAVATWNGTELPAQFVSRAEAMIELERAASSRD